MKIHVFKDEAEMIAIGLNYSKDLFITGEHRLVISLFRWDLEITW